MTYGVPFVRDQLDAPDPLFFPQKLLVLAVGILLFALLTGNIQKARPFI